MYRIQRLFFAVYHFHIRLQYKYFYLIAWAVVNLSRADVFEVLDFINHPKSARTLL